MTAMAAALYVAHTGHVLGAATRTGDPLGDLAPADLAGAAFPVIDGNTGDVLVEVDVGQLAVINVPLIDDLLLNPQQCSVDVESKTAELDGGTEPTVVLSTSTVKLTVTAAGEKRPAWVQLETGTGTDRKRIILSGEVAENLGSVVFHTTLATGDYGVLGLVQGHRAKATTASV